MTAAELGSISVNDLLRQAPGAGAVLNRLGIDTCCGARLPLDAAAANAGVPLEALLAAVGPVLPPESP